VCNEYSHLNLKNDQVTNIIFSLCLFEPQLKDDFTIWLEQSILNCEQIYPNLKDVYILFDTAKYNKKINSNIKLHHVFVPFFLLRSTVSENINIKKWSPRYQKALYMIGDIRNRQHKFPLLYDFYKHNKLSLLEYSLNEKPYDNHKDYFTHDNLIALINILNSNYNTDFDLNKLKGLYLRLKRVFPRDKYNLSDHSHMRMNHCAYMFPDEYNTTSLEIVAETHFFNLLEDSRHPYHFPFTEKIWKPILLGRPFVTISHNDMAYKSLELLGFKTFIEYTEIPYINNNESNIQKYTLTTIRRTNNFIKNMGKFENQIQEDIEYNKKRWSELCDVEWENLYANCPPLKNITKQEFGNSLIATGNIGCFHKYCI
jgi:hypothetical protein